MITALVSRRIRNSCARVRLCLALHSRPRGCGRCGSQAGVELKNRLSSKIFYEPRDLGGPDHGEALDVRRLRAGLLLWAASGPFFGFSDTWQLIVNTGTTIVTFLMVFLIQNTQNRNGAPIQSKLDELIRASAAQNIGIEHLTAVDLDDFRRKGEARQNGNRGGPG